MENCCRKPSEALVVVVVQVNFPQVTRASQLLQQPHLPLFVANFLVFMGFIRFSEVVV